LVRARAALVAIFDIAVLIFLLAKGHRGRLLFWLVALHEALGLLAICGPVADPLARGASALWLALWLRGHANSLALCREANILAAWAAAARAIFLDATDLSKWGAIDRVP